MSNGEPVSSSTDPSIDGTPLGKLEDITAEGMWNEYADSQLPGVEQTGEFVREQLRKAFLCGAWGMLSIEQRLRRESTERSTALLDRLRAEHEAAFVAMEGGPNG